MLIVLLGLTPVAVLGIMLGSPANLPAWVFAVLFGLLVGLALVGVYFLLPRTRLADAPTLSVRPLQQEVPEAMILKTIDVIYPHASYRRNDTLVIEGPLLLRSDAAYEAFQARFAGSGFTPWLQERDHGRVALVLTPSQRPPSPDGAQRGWLHLGLLFATLLTMIWAGAAHQGINLLENPSLWGVGLPYALALLVILGAHELGHFMMAQRYGMDVSWPFFIPMPFALGTFGAFIQMRSPAPHRRALFDVALAGPLAGLLVALPALLIGLRYSTLVGQDAGVSHIMGGADVGASVLFAFVAKLALGDALLEGHRLILHPLAFAGWLGLLLTALNLIPVGQLDGGHIAHAVLGKGPARIIGMATLVGLVLLGLFVWKGLLIWALVVFFIAGIRDVPPLDAVTPLHQGRMVLAVAALALLLLIILPVPPSLYTTLGLHSPYA